MIRFQGGILYTDVVLSAEDVKDLRNAYEEIKKAERERIIALLEKYRAVGYEQEMTHESLIALIKGEQK